MKKVELLLLRLKSDIEKEQSSCTTSWTEEQFSYVAQIIKDIEASITNN